MQLFLASLGAEISSFSPIPTSYRSFEEVCLIRGPLPETDTYWEAVPQYVFRSEARKRGWETIESLCAFAQPAGLPTSGVYEGLRDEILDDLKKAMPVDAVLLGLHGGLLAEGYEDCEGDILGRVRELVGPDVPVGAELDLHGHLSEAMIQNATALVTYKEFPHTDLGARASELFEIIADAGAGKTRPVMSLFDCRMIGSMPTNVEPMRSFVDRMAALEGKDGVISVSLAHSFEVGDVPDMGAKMLVVSDGRPEEGARLAERLGRELFAMRYEVTSNYLTLEQALDRALAAEATPVVIADVDDNPGGGAPSDTTFVLRALLDRGVQDGAIAYQWDPVAVRFAMEAGEGATLRLRIGGKTPTSGDPVDLDVTVTAIRPEFSQVFDNDGKTVTTPCGDCVAVRGAGIDIVLSSLREQPLGLDTFTGFDIDPRSRKILVVKSTQCFYPAFAQIAGDTVLMNVHARGTNASEVLHYPYRRITRPKWPFDEDPFGET